MKKLLISRKLPDRVLEEARLEFDVDVRDDTSPMAFDEMVAALRGFDGILATLGDGFSKDVFLAAGDIRCKILANFGVGYNHIDAKAAAQNGICVTNTPGAVTDATADIGMTLILMTTRRAGEGERLVRSGKWQGWHPTQLMGLHVGGKTVGIIGMGRIGQAIARRCHYGFGMDIVYFNRSEKTLDYPAEIATSLEALAGKSDVVVVAMPGGIDTHHFIGEDLFKAMKPTAHFVNIARGDIVNEAALIAALQAGEIAGAGLDVYEFEPRVPDALIAMENVTLLPHMGTAALDVREGMGRMALENLRTFFGGKTPINRV